MIVRTLDRHYQLITQNDHAHWAYQLLSLWPALSDHPRRTAILDAARLHDRGWQGIDAAPTCDEQGRPHDFLTLPAAEREEVWMRALGTPAAAPDERWRELLICHHAWAIHRPQHRRFGQERAPSSVPLFASLSAERERTLQAMAEHLRKDNQDHSSEDRIWPRPEDLESELSSDYAWLRAADLLSLIACNGWTEPFQVADPATTALPRPADATAQDAETLSVRCSANLLEIYPFPFAGSHSIPIRARNIPHRNYESASELSLELARAPWRTELLRLAPPAAP